MTEPQRPSLDAIEASAKVIRRKKRPDSQDEIEGQALSSRPARAEIGALEHANRDRVATRRLWYKYAKRVYEYLCYYSIGSAIIVLLAGFKCLGFSIPDIALTAIVGSTAAAAIGLVGFVVNGLFKNSQDLSRPRK